MTSSRARRPDFSLAAWGHRLAETDPRLACLVVLTAGLGVWRAGPVALGAYGLGFGLAFLCLRAAGRRPGIGWGVASGFVLFWAASATALAMVGTQALPLAGAALVGLTLAARLGVLVLIGASLVMAATARRMGLALAWALAPVLGRRAWQAALGLSLMVHFIPLTAAAARDMRTAVARRAPRLPAWRRYGLVAQATIRVMSQKTWEQAVAVAVRRLDNEAAWTGLARPGAGEIALGLGLAAGIGLLAWL